MLLRTLEKARNNKIGVTCFGGLRVNKHGLWSCKFSKMIHGEFVGTRILTFTQHLLNLSIQIAYYTHLLAAETIPQTHPFPNCHLLSFRIVDVRFG